ncbi:MAG TPA: hypothetical protein VHN59_06145 [Chitinophagaceae bacterium]|nr:hypothetical protein [Chitinophagaceae bacterium]
MKQCTKTLAATLFLTLGVSILSFGQGMYAGNTEKDPDAIATITKKEVSAENTAAVSPTIAASFSTLFPKATEPKWYEKDSYHFVSFLNNGRKATACFSSKGKMSYAITECRMENLPEAFSKEIQKDYAAYRLFRATEIQAYGQTAYQAIMENASEFITLKYTVEGVEEIKTVKK